MGIVVEDKKVRFDSDSHNLINNALEDNPVFQMAGGFTVYSVFRRIRTSSTKGDGNPLIYALKKKNGYTIERADVVPFLPFFYAIMDKLVPYCSMDYVIPMPSSSTVALRFAKRAARVFNSNLETSILQKKTNREICADVDLLLRGRGLPKLEERELKAVRAQLGRSLSTYFSMKLVDHKLRKHFSPFKLKSPEKVPQGRSILLVDDLLSSGASLACAKDLLRLNGVGEIRHLCLLSSTGAYKRL